VAQPHPAVDEERVPSGDARLRVRVEGTGPTVVLVHGWALDLDAWNPQAEALRDAFRVVRYDRPGFGQSTGAPSTTADVAAIEAIAAHLDLRSFAIVASSQAGRGVLRYALAHPGVPSALVLDGVPLEGFLPGPRAEHAAPVAELARALATEGVEAVRRRIGAHPFFQLRSAEPGAHELLGRVLTRYPAADLGNPAAPDTPVNVAARLAELTMPVLVVNGEHDSPHRVLTGDALAYGLPRGRRVLIRGAGHLANLDRAAEYSTLLREFLLAHPAAA
jgi:pimeloyl-ACP methyl ester carboxylesterase